MILLKRNYNTLSFIFDKLFLSTLLILLISNSNQTKSFHCRFDLISDIPIEIDETNIIPETSNFKKSFINTKDGFKNFNIYLDTDNFEKEIKQYNLLKNQ